MSARIRRWTAAAAMVIALSLAGCAPPTPGLAQQTSESWQTRVVAIAEHAAAGDNVAALEELATLEAEAREARQAGEITAERAAIIQQSIDLVRADLEEPGDTGVPSPDQTEDPSTDEPDDGKGNGNSGKGKGGGGKGNGD